MCRPGLFGQASGLRVSNTDRQAPASSAQAPPSPWPLGKAWQQQAWGMVQRAIMRRVTSRLRRTIPMRLRCMSHTRQHASNTNTRPSLASTNNGDSVCFPPCHMSMGVLPSPACVAPCACAFRSMSHAEKAWQLRAPRRMCPFACSRRTPSLAPHSVTMTKMLHVLMQHKLTEMLHARCVCHTRHMLISHIVHVASCGRMQCHAACIV